MNIVFYCCRTGCVGAFGQKPGVFVPLPVPNGVQLAEPAWVLYVYLFGADTNDWALFR